MSQVDAGRRRDRRDADHVGSRTSPRTLVRSLRESTRALHVAASACKAAGELGKDETRELQVLYKKERWAKVRGTEAIQSLIGEYQQRTQTLLLRLPRPYLSSAPDVAPDTPPARAAEASSVNCSAEDSDNPEADQLSDSQRALVRKKYELVCARARGMRLREAILESGLECSDRAARNYIRDYEKHGYEALIDRRTRPKRRARRVMTEAVQELVFDVWIEFPAAGEKAVWRRAKKECAKRGLPTPRYHSVWRFLKKQPRGLQLLRAGKRETFKKEMRSVVRFDRATKANEHFQLDHSQLDLWGKQEIDGKWRPVRVWVSTAIDEYSRSIAGFVVSSKHPDSHTVALLLYHAMLPKENPDWLNKGIPRVIDIDRGKDFMSDSIANSCAALGIRVAPNPPHCPDLKGKIERWFSTIDTACTRVLHGHKEAVGRSKGASRKHVEDFMTLPEIRHEIEDWIVHDYHRERHSETNAAPADKWIESVGIPRMPERDDALRELLLKTKPGRVRNDGIHFRNHAYWSAALSSRIGTRVFLRYHPDDLASVLVFDCDTNEFIGEVSSGIDATEVVNARRAHRRELENLIGRSRARAASIARDGRASVSKIEPSLMVDDLNNVVNTEAPDEEGDAILAEMESIMRAGGAGLGPEAR